jgi:hypothetical protein
VDADGDQDGARDGRGHELAGRHQLRPDVCGHVHERHHGDVDGDADREITVRRLVGRLRRHRRVRAVDDGEPFRNGEVQQAIHGGRLYRPERRRDDRRQGEVEARRAHCGVGSVTRKASAAGKKGKVLSQTPRAGKKLRNGARINLAVGKGPKTT